MTGVERVDIEFGQGGAHQIDLLAQSLQPRVGLGSSVVRCMVARAHIVGADEGCRLPDRPRHRRGVERQSRRDLIQQSERVAAPRGRTC